MERLKLIAMDREDLDVISTCCQDAVAKIADIEYFPAEKRFVLAFNRYAWEKDGKRKVSEWRRSVLHFNRVNSVKVTGIDRNRPEDILSFLAILFEPMELPGGNVKLIFSDHSTIQLNVECIEAQLSDMHATWKAESGPSHEAAD